MKPTALLIGVLAMAVGVTGLVVPAVLLRIGEYAVTPWGLFLVAAARVAIGYVLVRAAPASRTPTLLRAIGILVIVAGLVTLGIGADRARTMLEWEAAQGPGLIRFVALLAVAFGIYIAYAVRTPVRAV